MNVYNFCSTPENTGRDYFKWEIVQTLMNLHTISKMSIKYKEALRRDNPDEV